MDRLKIILAAFFIRLAVRFHPTWVLSQCLRVSKLYNDAQMEQLELKDYNE